MPEVAQATIVVTPVLSGAQESLTDQLTDAAGGAGTTAGTAAGGMLSKSMSDTLTKQGTTLTKTVTAPLAAVGTAAVASWKEVDTGLDTIVTKTGASGEALDEMQGILNNITTSIPTDFATAGAAIGEVNTRFGATGDELDDLSSKFIKFAKLNDQDVSSSVDSVSKMMAAFGMETEDTGKVLDALNTVGQQTGVDVGSLSDTVAANAAQFQAMGLSAYDAASFLGSASMAGLDSSTAMMGLKTAMKNATEEGVTLDEALAGFEETMNSNASESDKLAAAYELFGTRAGAAIENAVENGELDLDDFTSSLGDFEGSVDETFEGTIGPMDEFQTTLNEFKELGAEIVDAAGPALSDILGTIADAAGKLAGAWESLSPDMQDMVLKIAAVAAVAGPLMVGVGKIAGAFTSIKGVFSGGGVGKGISQAGTAASQASGPVSTAAGSFGTMAGQALKMVAAAAALYIAAQAIQVLVDAAIQITEAGTEAEIVLAAMGGGIVGLMAAAAALGPALTAGALGIGVFGAAMLGIGAGIDLACQGISKVVDSISGLVSTISENAPGINSIVTNIGETVSGVVDSVSDGITQVIEAISGGLSGVLDSLAGVFDSIGNAALNAGTGFEKLADAVINLVQNTGVLDLAATLGTVAAGVRDVSKAAKNAGEGADNLNTISSALQSLGSNTTSASAGMTRFGSVTRSAMTQTTSGFLTARVAMTGFTATAKTSTTQVASAFKGMKLDQSMKTTMNAVISTARSGISTLRSLFSSTHFSFDQHIAVPHFSMSGSFNAEKGTVPTVSTKWYKVAESVPYLFDRATLFGAGEGNQAEMLYGRDSLMRDIREATGGSGATITNNITISGTENPEVFARRLTREMHRQVRMGAV